MNNSEFKMAKKLVLQMFYEEENVFNTLVIPEGYRQCVLVCDSECKHIFSLFTGKLYRASLGPRE